MSRRLFVTVAVTAIASLVGGLLLMWAPSPGAPLSSTPRTSPDEFQVVGDGSLPDTRPTLREPGAPLSSAERGYAVALALAAIPSSARDVLGRPGAEVLIADLAPPEQRADRRRVQVSAYDYESDRLHQVLVDLVGGVALRMQVRSGLQLPPSAAETRVALDLALAADPAPAFIAQYDDLVGSPLLAGDQVRVVAGALADGCGSDRCVRLLVALPSGRYLSTDDFRVDLSKRTVVAAPGAAHHHG